MNQTLSHVKHVIAVASGKGGVGKSTTAANLAVAFANNGLRTGLLDADVYGPSGPHMLGLQNTKPTSEDGETITPAQNHGVKCMSMGFMVEEGAPVVWRGPMVLSALRQMLFTVIWGTEEEPLDVLVIDMPPGTGDTQLSLAQQVPLSGAIIVSTPQDIALMDAKKGLAMFQKVNVPLLGMVENMSSFICPNCQRESHIFSHGGAAHAATELGVPLLAQIPLDLQIRELTDSGKPVVTSLPQSDQAKLYNTMATTVWAMLEEAQQKAKGPVKIVFEESA